MSHKWVYISLGVAILLAATLVTRFYFSYNAPYPQPIYADDTDARVDFLINRMMEQETSNLFHEYWGPAMYELVKIGPRAVPKLIETISRAREIFISKELASGWQPSDFAISVYPVIIQTRAVMVLGKIADERALPILRFLRTQDDLCPLRCEVDEAIKSIERKRGN